MLPARVQLITVSTDMCGVGTYWPYLISGGSIGVPVCVDCLGFLCSIWMMGKYEIALGVACSYGHTHVAQVERCLSMTIVNKFWDNVMHMVDIGVSPGVYFF